MSGGERTWEMIFSLGSNPEPVGGRDDQERNQLEFSDATERERERERIG